MRRRQPTAGGRPAVPDWVTRFDFAAWVDVDEPLPPWSSRSNEDVWVFREVSAYRRWKAAGQRWLEDNGHGADQWYRLAYPREWAACRRAARGG